MDIKKRALWSKLVFNFIDYFNFVVQYPNYLFDTAIDNFFY